LATFSTPWDAVAGYELTEQYRTLITPMETGKEQRRSVWVSPRRAWKLRFRKNSTDFTTIKNFFEARLGAYEAFDWTDPDNVSRKIRLLNDNLEARVVNGHAELELIFVQVFDSDTTPPIVSSVTPVNGATDQAIDVNVVWIMAEAILPSDVTATYFHLIDSTTGVSVACALSFSGDGTTITLNPDANLTNNRIYLPRVEAGVHDLSNNQLVAAYGSKFTTIA